MNQGHVGILHIFSHALLLYSFKKKPVEQKYVSCYPELQILHTAQLSLSLILFESLTLKSESSTSELHTCSGSVI